jgi:malonyl-CoA O-methyltransferase
MIKQKIIRRFNSGAKTYDETADIQIIAAKELTNYLDGSAENVLEIGCGTGIFSQSLIEKYPNNSIYLTDIAPEMIRMTQEKFSKYSNITTLCMDGEHILLNKNYDLIASNMTLHWFINLVDSMRKIIDCLNSGGRFIFTFLGEKSLKEWHQLYPNTLKFPQHEVLKKYFPTMEIHTKTFSMRYLNAHHFLKTLRQIGGTATHESKWISSTKLREVLRSFNTSFTVTYEIIYGQYIKS